MKSAVTNFENNTVGEIELAEAVFGLPVRKDILARMVNYQLNKRRGGNHKTKQIWEVSGTTKKPYKQKGTGHARPFCGPGTWIPHTNRAALAPLVTMAVVALYQGASRS